MTPSKPVTYLLDYPIINQIYYILSYLRITPSLIFVILKSLFRSQRQSPKWSFIQNVSRYRNLWARQITSYARPPAASFILNAYFAKLSWRAGIYLPRSMDLYAGPMKHSAIVPQEVRGLWYPDLPPEVDGTRDEGMVLHFHGGAFVLGDPLPARVGYGAKKLCNHVAPRVLMLAYRLSSRRDGSGMFPAALQDALTAYTGLIDEGWDPKRIVISGDSAGANLALSFTRYLSEYGAQLGIPAPKATLLWSPWVDVTRFWIDETFCATHRKGSIDFVNDEFLGWGTMAYTNSIEMARDPYVTVTTKEFKSVVPIWIHAGSEEILYEDATELERIMKAWGSNVHLEISEGAVHDIVFVGSLQGWRRQAREAVRKAGAWVKSLGVNESSKL